MTDGESNLSDVDAELMRLATEGDDGDDQDSNVNDNADKGDEDGKQDDAEIEAEGAEDEGDKEGEDGDKPKRGRSWQQRVDALTARTYAQDAELKDLREKLAALTGQPQAEELKEPDPADYEFNEADPAYLKAHAAYLVKSTLANERKQADEAKQVTDAQAEQARQVAERANAIVETGTKTYEDFQAKIDAAVEAGNIPPPLAAAAIVASPVGSDLAYKLAEGGDVFDRIAAACEKSPQVGAQAIGELEAEFLPDDSDADLDLTDPLDNARLIGRMKARLRGVSKVEPRKVTRAPEPPEHRARGTGGKFEVSDDTEDFAAFERKIMGGR